MNDHPVENIGVERQLGIYMAGLSGERPGLPVSPEALEAHARTVMTPEAYGYVAGGAGSEDTLRANAEAFRRWRILPRMLRGVDERRLGTELFGQRLRAPFLLAPVGVLSIVHPEGEMAVARAAAAHRVPMVLSTVSSNSLEDVAAAHGALPRWFQLYWGKNRDFTASLLQRAEAAGYGALVVTLDTMLLSWRERDIQNAYLPFLLGEGLANYFSDPAFRDLLDEPPEENPAQAILTFAQIFGDASLTWDDLQFLRDHTRLPIVLKGILHPDDARRAADLGMDGVIVSNHGGRQVDGALGALDALPGVVEAVGDDLAVLFDSGIRRGADLFRAVALGARAVLLGRPYVYGLGAAGQEGVEHVLHNFLADVDLTLGLAGCTSFEEVDASKVVRVG